MIKIALGQLEVHPGRPDYNTKAMLQMIQAAKKQNAALIVFPEMAIPGYLLGDTWEQRAFLEDCEYHGQQIIAASAGICVQFGNVAVDWSKKNNDGRVRKYNALFSAYQGKLLSALNAPYPFTIKTLQPNYRAFDDTRHFYSLQQLAQERQQKIEDLLLPVLLPLPDRTLKLGCLLCEDGWDAHYDIAPMEILSRHKVDLFVNSSSSPYTLDKNKKRRQVFSKQAKNTRTPLIYVNATGIQNNGKTIYTFDGSSTVYDADGNVAAYCQPYQETLHIMELNLNRPAQKVITPPSSSDTATIYQTLSYGIKKFLAGIGIDKIVIGSSGGIDSAVAAALYAKVVGAENLLLVNMPSIYNSETTKNLSYELAKNLNCRYMILPIQESVNHTIHQLETTPLTTPANGAKSHLHISSFAAENIQARDRSARLLAAIAASFGGVFTCNANKSETTVGYSTLYGDQSGFLSALADLWKHQIYALAHYLNEEVYQREIIPQATIDIVPSAELSHDQAVDKGQGDPIRYPYHDYLFRSFMEHWDKAAPQDILFWYKENILEEKLGCARGIVAKYFPNARTFIDDLERWWNLYSGMAVAKRIQAPPILAVSRRTYGFDHREAQNGPYYTVKYRQLKAELLANSPERVQ